MRILILIFFIFFTSVSSENFEQRNKLNKLFYQLEKVNNYKTAAQLERAKNAFEDGDIDASKYARIVAGFNQGEEIPIELNLGIISQEDKYKANPDFAEYIATDTLGSEDYGTRGKSYEDVGIPSLIRNNAYKFIK